MNVDLMELLTDAGWVVTITETPDGFSGSAEQIEADHGWCVTAMKDTYEECLGTLWDRIQGDG